MTAMTRGAVAAAMICVFGSSQALAADPPEERTDVELPETHVPLLENFPWAEQIALYTIVAADVFLYAFQNDIVETLDPPIVGHPTGIDISISDALDRDGTSQWLGAWPDRSATIYFGTALGWYAFDAATLWIRGRAISGDPNADHELFAFVESYAVMACVTQLVKFAIGRRRPDIELRGRDPATDDEANLSFWSMHTSSSMTVAAFLTRDVGDRLADGPLEDHPVLAYLIPGTVFYGIATVIGLSRIIDQRHYFTDVLTGGMVGIAAGNLGYALHFDGRGRPKRWAGPRLVPMAGGVGVAWVW
jgi:membrane-associated phospholipid phosphatase